MMARRARSPSSWTSRSRTLKTMGMNWRLLLGSKRVPLTPSHETPTEDLSTIPYISQNYRFTEDELRWLRRSAFDYSEQSGIKISQNTILRVALRELRDACERNAKSNPLLRAIVRLKK